MKARTIALAVLLLAVAAASLSAHDMFIKLDNYFLAPGDTIQVPVLNGTFAKSENGIEFERVREVALLGPTGLALPVPRGWNIARDTTRFELVVKTEGTYVVGIATNPREIVLKAADFNAYLKEEGITDILARRKRLGQLGQPAKERYAKNVKAVFQVGEARTSNVSTAFRFPAEIVPLDNPYVGQRTGTLRMRCDVDGKPTTGLTVLVGSQKGHEKPRERSLVTDAHGVVTIRINRSGKWYVKFVRMVPVSGGDVDYESKWATLTFEVR